MDGNVLWYLSRATGSVSLLLLTVVVVLGTWTASHRRPHGSTSTVVHATHRWLSLGMSVFLLTHIVTAVLDGYVDIGWASVLFPFTSGYETVWVGLGTLALDVLLAVIVTSLMRHRLPERVWRGVHWFAYAMWPLAVVHGFFMGEANTPWLRYVTIVCGLVGVGAAVARLWTTTADAEARRQIEARGWL